MYTQINDPDIIIYDGETRELIGKGRFVLSPSAESALLDLVNYNVQPPTLLLLNAKLYEPADNYSPPIPYKEYTRYGRFTAMFTESYTRKQVPIEIKIKYAARANKVNPVIQNYYDSVVFSDIEVLSVETQ